MLRSLRNFVAGTKRLGRRQQACPSLGRRRLDIETLEDRVLMTASPLSFAAPAGNNTIVLEVVNSQIEILDNGHLAATQAVGNTSSIALEGRPAIGTFKDTFEIASTPAGIATTIAAGNKDSVFVETASKINGPLTIHGSGILFSYTDPDLTAVTIDGSGGLGSHNVTMNGGTITGLAPAPITVANISELSAYGAEGTNSYTFTGTLPRTIFHDGSASDTVTVQSIYGGLTIDCNSGNTVTVHSANGSVAINGQAGTTVNLYGATSGVNTFQSQAGQASLTGSSYSDTVTNVGQVTAYSFSASDTATIHSWGTAADTLTAKPGDAVLTGTGYRTEASGFGNLTVYGAVSGAFTGDDTANLYSAAGMASTLSAGVESATLSGTNYSIFVNGFNNINVYSQSISDTATVMGSFVGSATQDTVSAGPYSSNFFGFRNVQAQSVTPGDTAVLNGPAAGGNNLEATATSVFLAGNGYTIGVSGYRNVQVFSNAAGDIAHLNPLSSTDTSSTVDATPGMSQLSNNGSVVQLSGFTTVYEYLTPQVFAWTSAGEAIEYGATGETAFQQIFIGNLVNRDYVWVLNGASIQYLGGPSSVRASDIAVVLETLGNAELRSVLLRDMVRDGALTYAGMLDAFTAIEGQGSVTSAELGDLESVIEFASILGTPADVTDLAKYVVYGQQSNNYFFYLNSANASFYVPLGNLSVGSSSTQLAELVDKWFLGENNPVSDAAYSPDNGSLFGPSGPLYTDVQQGNMDDCWLVAGLASTAFTQPGYLTNMFTFEGTNVVNGAQVDVYSVRLFDTSGVAHYLTVDTELPGGGGYYAATEDGTWVALAEKAYAEANAAGWVQTGHANLGNSYASLSFGYASWLLTAVSGEPYGYAYPVNASQAANAFESGQMVCLGTGSSPQSSMIYPKHAYAVVGYNSSTNLFEIYNPWGNGIDAKNNSQYYGGLFSADANFVNQNFNTVDFTGGAANTSGTNQAPASTALHSLPQSAGGSAVHSLQLAETRLLDAVFATLETQSAKYPWLAA